MSNQSVELTASPTSPPVTRDVPVSAPTVITLPIAHVRIYLGRNFILQCQSQNLLTFRLYCVPSGVLNSLSEPYANPLHGGGGKQQSVANSDPNSDVVTMVPVATAGPCYSQCEMIMPFMVLLFFMTLVVAVTQMPVLMVVLR